MLVLTRKLQQQIKIGEEITITILRVKGNTVRVGVQAPRDVRVIRGELPKNADATASELEVNLDGVHHSPEGEFHVATAEAAEPVDAAAGDSVQPAVHTLPLPLPAAAHLPLRRIRNRHGVGPLKQIIASCGVLAK